ncbi:MAG: hypothetical protein QXT72_04845 [Candidatus Micrarchaeia archaeon]
MEIQNKLRMKIFKPSSLRRAYIPKSNEKIRGLKYLQTRIS